MKMILVLLTVLSFSSLTFAEETIAEKGAATANTAKRAVKKGYHRTTEALCGKLTGDNKVQCLAKQAANRLEEGKDAVVDKGSEVKNSVDSGK